MSSLSLTPASSLGPLVLPASHNGAGEPGIIVAARTDLALCSVLARKGADQQLAERVRQAFFVELPCVPRYTGPGKVAFAWAGPGQWLALGEGTEGQAFEALLRWSLASAASVIDQSDGRTIIRVGGARVRDALAKGVQIDLHPSVFGPGCAATTQVAYIGVHFWQVDESPTYEFAVFRSFAVSFCEWLADAAAEYGVAWARS